ncbi:MAG: outer membrane beta-barrel family protein, partial [Bacteroidales bacterium]|nr:outer membrane beta-barrel family protein [Bacteroidales bacterium]
PFKNNKTRLDVGVKYSFVANNNNLEYWAEDILDTNQSNQYLYSEHIAAVYAMVSHKFTEKTSLQVGLRGEYTKTIGYNVTMDSNISSQYIMPFPSVNFNQLIGKKHGINISYRYRLSRPRYTDLNPFTTQHGLFSESSGNPYLKPEYSHSVGLTYSFNSMPIFKFNYDRSDGMISSLDFVDETTFTRRSMPQNLGSSDRLSTTLMFQKLFFDRWQFMIYANGSWSQSRFDYGNSKETKNSYSAMLYCSNDIKILNWLSAEVNAWCMLPGKELFNKTRWMLNLDAGMKMTFFKKAFTVRISGTDLLNTASQWISNTVLPDGNSTHLRAYWLSRGVSLSLSYNFSKGKVTQQKQIGTSIQEESGRFGSGGGRQQGGMNTSGGAGM